VPEPPQELLASVASDEQGDERTNCRAVEPGGYLLEALIDGVRIEVVVELLMDEVRDVVQVLVDARLC